MMFFSRLFSFCGFDFCTFFRIDYRVLNSNLFFSLILRWNRQRRHKIKKEQKFCGWRPKNFVSNSFSLLFTFWLSTKPTDFFEIPLGDVDVCFVDKQKKKKSFKNRKQNRLQSTHADSCLFFCHFLFEMINKLQRISFDDDDDLDTACDDSSSHWREPDFMRSDLFSINKQRVVVRSNAQKKKK